MITAPNGSAREYIIGISSRRFENRADRCPGVRDGIVSGTPALVGALPARKRLDELRWIGVDLGEPARHFARVEAGGIHAVRVELAGQLESHPDRALLPPRLPRARAICDARGLVGDKIALRIKIA
jgi:hypothetical protein